MDLFLQDFCTPIHVFWRRVAAEVLFPLPTLYLIIFCFHLQGVCTEAGMYALRERRVHVTQEDFELAVAKVRQRMELIPVACFTKQVNPSLAKPPLNSPISDFSPSGEHLEHRKLAHEL